MAHTEKESIYLDLQELRKTLRKAGYEMEARNRVDYLVDAQHEVANCIRYFVRAKRQKSAEDAFSWYEKLDDEFAVVKIDLRTMNDEHIFKGKKDKFGNVVVEKMVFDAVARIDEALRRWRSALLKGRPVTE